MCVSMSPGVPVRFSDTILYGAEVEVSGQTVHVLGYQNVVQNRAGGLLSPLLRWFSSPSTGNAMILPFPVVPGTMTRANVLDTSQCRNILQTMMHQLTPHFGRPIRSVGSRAPAAPRIQVFPAAGIYTVVLAQDARDIPAALVQVPEAKRPAPNPALFEAYARWYPGWTIALCCFNNEQRMLADPMLWWYEPMTPEQLFLPTLDCHTGAVPNLDAKVNVDHTLAVGSWRMPRRYPSVWEPYLGSLPAAVAPYVLPEVIGSPYRTRMKNGDFGCAVADIRQGVFAPVRRRPPAA